MNIFQARISTKAHLSLIILLKIIITVNTFYVIYRKEENLGGYMGILEAIET
jgi:hypothetical protein